MPLYTFVDNAVPTSSQWNANLRDQVVTQCTSGTRPASPAEGQHIYETDTDRVYVYDGSSWICTWAKGATYTPTLVGMAIGTGGSAANTATWGFAGGTLNVIGQVVFGTSGTTFPAATITVSLPSGFTASPTFGGLSHVGRVAFSDAGITYDGAAVLATSSTLRFVAINVAGTYPVTAATSTTVPFTWAAGDAIYWAASIVGSF